MEKKLTDRFLKYVKVDTQSAEDSATCPSTEKQWKLARMLREELQTMQLEEIELDEHCYLYATLPANTDKPLPTIGFIAHLDTSPDCIGSDVEPRIVLDYDGSDIVLDKQEGVVTRLSQFPELKRHIGEDLIVTNGHTLLGADDKAGIAEIVTAMEYLLSHPEIKHGKVRIAFTPDEEIGKGAHLFDVQKFGCDWAYTMDGGEEGELEYENFNAASAKVTVSGINVHPGYAKGKMLNALLVANEFVSLLPENERPEKTKGYEGFFHIISMNATVEKATVSLIIRDHNAQMFTLRKQVVYDTVERLNQQYGPNVVRLELTDQYQNMVTQISDKPHIIQVAEEAIRQACGHCKVIPIRGGTDGAQLSFRGLPCPNIFAGGLNFHGRHEFVTIQNMQKATQTIINIIRLVAQSGYGKQ